MELHRVHRRISAVAAAAVAATVVIGAAGVAVAVEDVETDRIAGQDRFGTAAAIATEAFPNGADTVVVASGRAFPDALAGAALGLPVLLTEADRLPSATSDALADLEAERVLILGGTAAVSSAVESALEDEVATVDRIAGADRYETAAEIAEAIGADQVSELDDLPTAIIATGLNFADALAGGPIAAAGAGTGVHPILLTGATVPDATEAALETLGIEQVVILGGTGAVPTSVEEDLEEITGNDAIRLAGGNRFATAVEIAEAAIEDFDFPADEVLLANGLSFADALAGGPLGAVRTAPIILTDVNLLPAVSEAFFEDHADTIELITALGGTAAVSNSVLGTAEQAAEQEAPPARPANETLVVDPQGAADVANGGSREYTVTELTGPVDIVLLECGSVTRGTANTNTTFRNTNANSVADGTAISGGAPDEADVANVHISAVNGSTRTSVEPATTNNDYANNVSPSGGEVTFVVTGPAADSTAAVCVQPVVFVDANGDNRLNVPNGTAVPNEQFGVGGTTTFSRGGAAAGQFGPHNVTSASTTDKANDRFTACAISEQSGTNELVSSDCKTFRYDANDVFQISAQVVSFATWEAALSTGDDVQGTYAVEPGGQSTFNLTDEDSSAGAPTITSARGRSADGTLNEEDVHELVFSEAMNATTASGTYTVRGTNSLPSEVEIDCGGNATCVLVNPTTLRVTIGTIPPVNAPTYPLTITETTGMPDTGNQAPNLSEGDTVIEQGSLPADERPFISAAQISTDANDDKNFGTVGDVMDLTFSEAVVVLDGLGPIEDTELEEITGRTVEYGSGTVVTVSQPSSNVLRFTVSGASFASGLDAVGNTDRPGSNKVIDGSSNDEVADSAGNLQQPNPSANPELQPEPTT